jgi:hypothetical protein
MHACMHACMEREIQDEKESGNEGCFAAACLLLPPQALNPKP